MGANGKTDCSQIEALFVLWNDELGELEDSELLSEHMQDCEACRVRCVDVQTTKSVSGPLLVGCPRTSEIVAFVDSQTASQPGWFGRKMSWPEALVLAGIVLALGLHLHDYWPTAASNAQFAAYLTACESLAAHVDDEQLGARAVVLLPKEHARSPEAVRLVLDSIKRGAADGFAIHAVATMAEGALAVPNYRDIAMGYRDCDVVLSLAGTPRELATTTAQRVLVLVPELDSSHLKLVCAGQLEAVCAPGAPLVRDCEPSSTGGPM